MFSSKIVSYQQLSSGVLTAFWGM